MFEHIIPTAFAQEYVLSKAEITALDLVAKINEAILFPLVTLLMALAFLYFLWGGFEFVKNANNEAARETGRQHMLFGTIGMLVMLSAFAILSIAAGTFGLSDDLYQSTDNRSDFAAPSNSPRPVARPAEPTVVPPAEPTVVPPAEPTVAPPAEPTVIEGSDLPRTEFTGNQSSLFTSSQIISTYNNVFSDTSNISEIIFAIPSSERNGNEESDCELLGGTANTVLFISDSYNSDTVYVCGK